MKFRSNLLEEIPRYFAIRLEELYPPREAENMAYWAIEHYHGYTRPQFMIHSKDRLSESEMLKYIHCVDELRTGRPIQYVLGESHFRNLKLYVAEGVLIPRPETEELIEWIVSDYRDQRELRVLDIGSGSGCIPLALKDELNTSEVYSIDISERALSIAEKNALNLRLNVSFVRCDVLNDELPVSELDIVVSNPPYVTQSERSEMHKNVLEFEPDLALFVEDEEPLLFYQVIAAKAKEALKVGGALYFEINRAHGPSLTEMLAGMGYTNLELRKDLIGNDRMVKAIWNG